MRRDGAQSMAIKPEGAVMFETPCALDHRSSSWLSATSRGGRALRHITRHLPRRSLRLHDPSSRVRRKAARGAPMTTQGNIATTNVLAPRPRDLASATPSATAAYLDGSQKPL